MLHNIQRVLNSDFFIILIVNVKIDVVQTLQISWEKGSVCACHLKKPKRAFGEK